MTPVRASNRPVLGSNAWFSEPVYLGYALSLVAKPDMEHQCLLLLLPFLTIHLARSAAQYDNDYFYDYSENSGKKRDKMELNRRNKMFLKTQRTQRGVLHSTTMTTFTITQSTQVKRDLVE